MCLLGSHQGGHATTHFLEGLGFLEGSLKEVLLRMVLRRSLVRVLVGTEVLRRALRQRRHLEGALKAKRRSSAEYDPLCIP